MDPSVIKSFMVGLGFGVDEAGYKKFKESISEATLKVTALFGATQLMAAGIVKSISSISEGFEQMGYEYRIIAPAINKALVLRQELLKAYAAAGINITKVIQQSIKFNMSLAKTQFALKAIYTSVGAKFFPLLTKQMDIFRSKIYANMPKIQASLEKFVLFIFKAFEATTILGGRVWSILERVYEFFAKLHQATDGWSTIILGVIAAWKLLNLTFLATPFGMIVAGITALIALWDDFKTYKEGGQSLIDWGSDTVKVMVGLAAALVAVASAWYAVRTAVTAASTAMKIYEAVQAGVNIVMALNPIGLIIVGITALIALLTAVDAKWNLFGGHLSGFFSGVGGKIMDWAGGASPQNVQNNPTNTQPIGAGIANNNQSNQNVQQQTNINVMGSADAGAVGKSVAGEQSRVNFDMVRNMKGATR